MSPEAMRKALRGYVEAVNDHDVDAMLALRHPNASLEIMGSGTRLEGKERLAAFYRAFFAEVPDYRLAIDGEAYGEDVAAVWGSIDGTVNGSFGGRPVRGGSFSLPVSFVCEFRSELFCDDHMYVDGAAWQAQIDSA